MIGIYKITCGGRWYFGQSINTHKRSLRHLNELKKNKHTNSLLQNVYNKHGDFKFEVIMECPVEELDIYEQMILDVWHGEPECMNLEKIVGFPTRGRKHTDESRAKMSTNRKGKSQSCEHVAARAAARRGQSRSEEAKAKQSTSMKGKPRPEGAGCTPKQIEIDGVSYPSLTEASKHTGISISTLSRRLRRLRSKL